MPDVLFVDDDTEIRTILSGLLRSQGADVVECAGAREARKILESRSFDLVVTDFHMPDGDGGAVIRAAQEFSPGAKCVLITGNMPGVPEDVRRAAAYTLEKPNILSALIGIVEEASHATKRSESVSADARW